jgi:HEPN domain-containing protein
MPIDVAKHVTYWRSGASEDIDTARVLLERDKRREALFFAHLALEKALKALVVKATQDLAPLSHNLVLLAEKTSLEFQEPDRVFFVDMNRYSLHGRYPDPDRPLPGRLEAEEHVRRAEETLAWLIQK